MSTSMREALKPCPFCGSKSLTLTVNEHHWKIVECDDCGMRGPCIDLEDDEYLARWNTRAALSSPTPDRLSEEERAFLARMKKTPLKDIDRGDRCMMIDIIDRLSRQPEVNRAARYFLDVALTEGHVVSRAMRDAAEKLAAALGAELTSARQPDASSEQIGLNWKISDRTKQEIAEIESNQRHAFLNANNITAGRQPEVEPVAWGDSEGRERPIDAEAMKQLRLNPTTETFWSRFSIPLYTSPRLDREWLARSGIYIASKTRHAARWKMFRDGGQPIISTWIDEAGEGQSADLNDLWQRCIREASTAAVLITYREAGDIFKGAWVEIGAALASGVPVLAVGIEHFTIAHDRRITHFNTIEEAFSAADLIMRETR